MESLYIPRGFINIPFLYITVYFFYTNITIWCLLTLFNIFMFNVKFMNWYKSLKQNCYDNKERFDDKKLDGF